MGTRFFAGTEDGNVICFNEQAKAQWTLRVGKGSVTALHTSIRGSILAVTNEGVLARVADKGDKGALTSRKTSEGRSYVGVLEVGERIIVATDDGLISFVDADTLEMTDDLDLPPRPITSLALQGDVFFYACADGSLHKRSNHNPQAPSESYAHVEADSEITSIQVRGDYVFAQLSSGAIDAFNTDDTKAEAERAFEDALRMGSEGESNVVAIDGEGVVWRINQALASSQIGRIELEDMIVSPVERDGVLAICRVDGHAEVFKVSSSISKVGTLPLNTAVTCLTSLTKK